MISDYIVWAGEEDYEGGAIIPNDSEVSPSDLKPGANLSEADLSNATLPSGKQGFTRLWGADLSGAHLNNIKKEEGSIILCNANLSGADLRNSEFSADFRGANLTDAKLNNATIRGSTFHGANLTGVDFRGATLHRTHLLESTLEDIIVSGSTIIETNHWFGRGISDKELCDPVSGLMEFTNKDYDANEDIYTNYESEKEMYDAIARVHRKLRGVYSQHGLLARARTERVRERTVRRKEAKADGGWRGTADWVTSLLSRIFTGYGVRLTPVVGWIVMLWLLSAGVYWYWGGMAVDRSLYYSVVTLTTAPPATPPPGLPSFVAAVETIVGTLGIVLLGYVIASRERI